VGGAGGHAERETRVSQSSQLAGAKIKYLLVLKYLTLGTKISNELNKQEVKRG
jgi:hypothetical protein